MNNSPYLSLPLRTHLTAQINLLAQKMKDGDPPIEMLALALEISQKLTEGAEWTADQEAWEALQDLRQQIESTGSDYLAPAQQALEEQENERLWQEWQSDNPNIRIR
ncbi:MAG: hypothetical protein ACR2QC_04120 [Gammaproteobacteria bacterium]